MRDTVRRGWWIWVCIVAFGVVGSAAQRGAEGTKEEEQFLGTWTGTWDGGSIGGSGGFELTLEKGADGAIGGKVSVTGEPTYKAILRTVAFDGKKMSAKYDFPPDERAEVVLDATFEGRTATGRWIVREKAGGTDALTGTWTVTKK